MKWSRVPQNERYDPTPPILPTTLHAPTRKQQSKHTDQQHATCPSALLSLALSHTNSRRAQLQFETLGTFLSVFRSIVETGESEDEAMATLSRNRNNSLNLVED